jgi:hypothetical protein
MSAPHAAALGRSATIAAMPPRGRFSVVKVRPGLAADDYKDPGWYRHPEGTVASELSPATPPHSGAKAAESAPSTRARDPVAPQRPRQPLIPAPPTQQE